jgi:hypothetical protein
VNKARARVHLIQQGVPVPADAGLITIGPETVRYLNLFAHKAVLALYFEQYKMPLSNVGAVYASWRTKEDFTRDGIPSFFLDMLPGYGTIMQGSWNERETFEYRHAVNEKDGLFGCLARFRQGYFVYGFAVADAACLPSDESDWVKPCNLLSMLTSPRFAKKH